MSTRCYTHLSDVERETLSLGLAQGQSLRTMAAVLARAPITVSREYARNTTRGCPYCGPALRRPRLRLAPLNIGAPANSGIPGCGRMPKSTCARGVPLSRLPDAFDARILTTWANTCRPRPFMRPVCAASWDAADRIAGGPASGAQGASASGARDGSTGPDPQCNADCGAPR